MTQEYSVPFASTKVTQVTVFPHSAEVTRVVEFEPQSTGESVVKVHVGRSSPGSDSVRVKGLAGKCVLIEVQTGLEAVTRNTLIDENPEALALYSKLMRELEEKAKIESSLECTEKKKALFDGYLQTVVHERSGLLKALITNENGPASFAHGPSDSAKEELIKVVDPLDHLCEEVTGKFRVLNLDRLSLSREHQDIKQRCNKIVQDLSKLGVHLPYDLNQDAVTNYKQAQSHIAQNTTHYVHWIKAKLDVQESTGKIKLAFKYLVHEPFWKPSYDFRISSSDLSRLHMSYFGVVTQNTLENWNDLELRLSTGNPAAAGHPPDLPKLSVSFKPTAPTSGSYGGAAPGPRMLMMARRAPSGMLCAEADFQVQQATAEATNANAEFVLGSSCSVPSDSDPHRFTITEATIPVSIVFYCAPEAASQVFRAGTLVNGTDFLLLESDEVSVFWDDAFTSKTRVSSIATGENFQLFFGAEQRIKVDVKPQKRYRKTAGNFLAGTSDKEFFEQSVSFQNLREDPITMMSVHRLPDSTDETIKVVLEGIKPLRLQADTDLELLSMKQCPQVSEAKPLEWLHNTSTQNCVALIHLKPSEKRLLTFSYSIESPTQKEVIVV